MTYDALSIDTSVFDRYGIEIETGLLKRLNQFKRVPTSLILSDIVTREVECHLERKIRDARGSVTKAIKSAGAHLVFDASKIKEAEESLFGEKSDKELAQQRLTNFYCNSGVEIINSGNVQVSELTEKYFNNEPPFSESRKKKNEFPDAIALISLEKWAIENGKKILAVSTDHDWEKFAEESENIDVVNDLGEAISLFQPKNKAYFFASSLTKELPTNDDHQITKYIESSLPDIIADLEVYAEAYSNYSYEEEMVEVVFNNFWYNQSEEGKAYVKLVEIEEDYIVIELSITINCTASCYFSFYTKDWIDKDYVTIGDNTIDSTFDFKTGILLTCIGEFEKGIDPNDYDIDEIELLEKPNIVEFGEVDLDYGHDEY